jgi:hypothetical protein
VLQRIPLCLVPLHLRPEREKKQEAEGTQAAFSEILILLFTIPF